MYRDCQGGGAVFEDRVSLVASGGDVIQRAVVFDP
jgi:hypothetical protein